MTGLTASRKNPWKERYQMQRSLDLAKEVQQNLLPREDPVVRGLDVAGRSIYCDETGGDYFDYLSGSDLGPAKFGVLIGDVSGHGIPSALLMATARAFLRQRTSRSGSMAEVVSDVNRQLARDVEDTGRFMTLFYLMIDLDTIVAEIENFRQNLEPEDDITLVVIKVMK